MISPAASHPTEAHDQPPFLATIGHELRNPLSCILAQAETLQDGLHGPVSQAQYEVLQSIQDDVRRTLSLVADLADLGRIEANALILSPVPCNVSIIQRQVMEEAGTLAASRSIHLSSAAVSPSLQVVADETRLRQILLELISSVLLTAPVGGRASLSVTPSATGLLIRAASGLSQKDLQWLPASALDDDDVAKSILQRLLSLKPLGITLLRKLVQLQGGTFSACTTPGSAVCLTINLPLSFESLAPIHMPPISQPAVSPVPASTALNRAPIILLADDQPTLISVTTHYLESLGFEVHSARDGQEAIRKAHELKPDLILMDVRMPVLDGPQAIMAIRASDDAAVRAISIISVSGQSGPADMEKCLAAGASSHLAKPFGVKELDQAIRQYVSPPAL